ncbi:hypothetical protein PR202_gb13567 [Eleusine coracana subsp. coracana]|uniref:ABC transporter domain-containing protein n=1 Tax=Eleusine coracana subsp. coracana TaxID=191504 RepID=A0AAV5EQU8_ELECO|nr:hypothetical protein PR202_gb13567 [Eleusine coracana subsp. coracana]
MAAMDLLSGKLLRSVRLHSPALPSPPSTSLPSRRLRRRRLAPLHCRLTTSSSPSTSTTTTTDEKEDSKTQDISSLLSSSSDPSSSAAAGKKKRSNSGASSIPSGVRLENISKSYKGATVLKDVSWEVQRGEKVGLVGVNGAGKTTQLRIIAGLEEPDGGTVVKAKDNMKIAFLSQEFEVSASRTVREEFFSAFAEEMEVKRRLDQVQAALESATEDMDLMGRLLDELDLLQRRSQDVDLDMVEVKVQKLMPELGFAPEDADRLVASFSGGWKMRMSLGKILLQDPDLLLLDEPTNHVDLDTIEWLESYLKTQDVPMVIISHDRAFLDQLCTKIVETEFGVSKTYKGNYSEYILAKEIWVQTQYAAWEKQQKEIEQTKELINRLGAGVNAGRASSEQKKLEKLEKEGLIEKPFQRKQLKIRFPERGRSGRTVLAIKNLQFGFGDKMLFNNANLIVERGEKIAIIGPNGCGKSTLLKLILGMEKPQGGEVILGDHNVLPNYFEQNQARLAFCKFMVTPSTLLILDEPTNHLDIPSKEMLEEAISEYTGTVITVSHDRYFIKQIVNRVIEVTDQTIQDYKGDYNYYLERNLEARERELAREEELEEKAPKVKAKSKMSKAEKIARKKQKMQAFQQSKQKSKGLKNAKRWN